MTSGNLLYNDDRGRHMNRPARLPENIRGQMTTHIESYPTYLSHYHRQAGDPERQYLGSELNATTMFESFVAAYGEEASNWSWAYRQILRQMNLKFAVPKKDTCSRCDEYSVRIEAAAGNEELLFQLHLERVEHHKNAEDGYEEMRRDKQRSIVNQDYISLSWDMQGVLFSPIITNPEYFYSRKFSTHNLAIVEAATDAGTMCIWHCTEGGKGSTEVASCILKYCQKKYRRLLPNERRTLICWSDRCTGQNNNQFVVILLKYLIEIGLFTTIEQQLLTTGHNFLPPDRQFALIEKNKKNSKIYEPDDWITVITEANKKTPNSIEKMNLEDFKNFRLLVPYFRMPRTLRVTQVKWIRLERDEPHTIFTKDELDTLDWTEHVVRNYLPMQNFIFQNMYQNWIRLDQILVNDLRKLQRWIPEEHKIGWAFLDDYPED